MRDVPIVRIMTTDPLTIGPQASAAEASALFESRNIHHLPVVDEGRLVGIVTTADLSKLFLLDRQSQLPESATVAQIMEPQPMTLPAGASLRQAAEQLQAASFHALPVIDEARRLVGIVTSADLIDTLLKSLPVGDGSLIEEPEQDLAAMLEDNRKLRNVYEAAELYIRSGHGEREHSVLVKRLAEVRGAGRKVAL